MLMYNELDQNFVLLFGVVYTAADTMGEVRTCHWRSSVQDSCQIKLKSFMQ